MKNVIRWKFVLPTALAALAIVLFFILIFDGLLERSLEYAGGSLNGARVEIAGLRTSFLKGRLQINHLAVTNKNDVMKNIVEAGPMAFQLSLGDAFTKRFIVPEASLQGLQFDTPRKISGALPKRKTKKSNESTGFIDKWADKVEDRFAMTYKNLKLESKEKIEFNADDLNLTKEAKSISDRVDGYPDELKQKWDKLQVELRLKKIEAQVKELENTPTKGQEALTALPEALKKLNETKKELDLLKSDVTAVKDEAGAQIKSFKSAVSSLYDAKNKDMNDLLSRFNLDFADPKKLMESVVGPSLLRHTKTAFHYVQLARKYMPAKKEAEAVPQRPRMKGINISFPTPAAPPRFWIQKADLGGQFNGFTVSGLMKNLTENPSRAGQPFTLNLSGQESDRRFNFDAMLDHVKEDYKDSFSIEATHLPAKDLLSDGMWGEAITEGTGDMSMSLTLFDEGKLGGTIGVALRGVKLNAEQLFKESGLVSGDGQSREDKLKAGFFNGLIQSVEKLPVLEVKANVKGTFADPDFVLSSNLVEAFRNGIKDSVGQVVKDQKAQLEAQLDAILVDKKSSLQSKISSLTEKIDGQAKGWESKISEEINKASGLKLGGDGQSPIPGIKIPSLDKLFKK